MIITEVTPETIDILASLELFGCITHKSLRGERYITAEFTKDHHGSLVRIGYPSELLSYANKIHPENFVNQIAMFLARPEHGTHTNVNGTGSYFKLNKTWFFFNILGATICPPGVVVVPKGLVTPEDRAFTDLSEINVRQELGETIEMLAPDHKWRQVTNYTTYDEVADALCFRTKKVEMVTINGRQVKKGITQLPKDINHVYVSNPANRNKFYKTLRKNWNTGTTIDEMIDRGLVHLDEKDAIAMTDALLAWSK